MMFVLTMEAAKKLDAGVPWSQCLTHSGAMRMQAKEAVKQLDAEQLAALPGPCEVDFLCGGPPCQGYSGMNRFNKGDALQPSSPNCPALGLCQHSCLG